MRHKDDSKREAISNAAIELITSIGFAATSMSKIAKAAGVSPATIYIYFKNKEDMLNQLYLMVKREISEAMLDGIDDNLSVAIGFERVWKNSCSYLLSHPAKFVFSEQFANSPLVNRICVEEISGYYQTIISLLEHGQREGIFKDIPLELFTTFFYGPLLLLVKKHHNGTLVLDDELQQTTFNLTWDALTV